MEWIKEIHETYNKPEYIQYFRNNIGNPQEYDQQFIYKTAVFVRMKRTQEDKINQIKNIKFWKSEEIEGITC